MKQEIELEEVLPSKEPKSYKFVDKVKENPVLPDLPSVLTEIELDNALINSAASSTVARLSEDSASLGDSGSSNSSLLGKLEDCMKTFKESNEAPKLLNESQDSYTKKTQQTDVKVNNEVVKLDLRSTEKVHTIISCHFCSLNNFCLIWF